MKLNRGSWLFLPLLLLFSCTGNELPDDNQEVKSYKVAVVLPFSEREGLNCIVDWAQENIKAAQKGQKTRIELSLQWIDEDGAGMQEEVMRVTHDVSYAAVIGPRYSHSARILARESLSYRIPVLLPSVTSTEFQRIYAGTNISDPNIFCLSENDMSQCMAMLSKARANNYYHISLLSRDGKTDDYAASFQQFYAYLAREMDMVAEATYFFENKEEMEQCMLQAIEADEQAFAPSVLIFVPSSRQDVLDFDELAGRHSEINDMKIVCTDMAYDFALEGKLKNYKYEGTALGARPGEGFDVAWKTRYGHELPGGYAQLYDSFYLLAMAAAMVEGGDAASVREAILTLTTGEKAPTPIYNWTVAGMRNAFQAVRDRDYRLVTGVSGPLHFEEQTHICQLGTNYSTWTYSEGSFLVTGRFSRQQSGGDLWNWTSTQVDDQFDEDASLGNYPALTDNYAVIIAASTGWNNYRHQADALAHYQMLKGFGFDDDHIILIMEDDIANNPANPNPGVVHVVPGGENVREGAVIDYRLSDLRATDMMNIMSGTVTDRTPIVFRGSPGTNLFLFWSGHGARDNVLKWGSVNVEADTFKAIVEASVGNFRKMLAVMETCYSGSIGKYCEGIPGVLFLCAASSGESSHADVLEDGIYLSNRFTRIFRSEVEANPSISMHDLYYQLATHTTGSHAGLYNDENYGNIYRNTMKEFLVPVQE